MEAKAAVGGALTANQRRMLTSINAGASGLSLAGSSFIVLCYLLFKELRKFSFKLVFYLALSDMFCSFFSIVGYVSFFPGAFFFMVEDDWPNLPFHSMKFFSTVSAGIHPEDSSAMLRDIAPISSVYLLSFGLLSLLLPSTVPLSSTKPMLKILRPCFTCMSGVCVS